MIRGAAHRSENNPSISRFERGRGGMYPLKKTVRIKIKTKNKTPPSHFLSEGGGDIAQCWKLLFGGSEYQTRKKKKNGIPCTPDLLSLPFTTISCRVRVFRVVSLAASCLLLYFLHWQCEMAMRRLKVVVVLERNEHVVWWSRSMSHPSNPSNPCHGYRFCRGYESPTCTPDYP